MAVEEWDRRQLCPDGGCTGVINATGVCSVCGRAAPNWGDERKRGLRNPTDAPPIVKDEDDIAPSAPAALGAMADWGTRRLCSDGGCIGVIGPNNRCKVCGKPGPAKATKGAPKAKAESGDAELERVAAEMAGTASAGDLASIVPSAAEDDATDDGDEDDGEYEDDEDEDSDEDDEHEDDGNADEAEDATVRASGEAHDHGDENDSLAADEDEENEEDETSGDDDSDDASDEDDEDDDDGEDDDEEDDADEDEDDDADEGDDDGAISAAGRELCPDGACVGVIGADGRCKICKKSRDWKETA